MQVDINRLEGSQRPRERQGVDGRWRWGQGSCHSRVHDFGGSHLWSQSHLPRGRLVGAWLALLLVFHLGSFQSPGCLAAVGQDHRPYRAAENPPRAGLNARGCLGLTTEIPEQLWVPTTALHPAFQQLKKAGPGAGRSRTDGETFGSGPRPADDGGRSARATKLSPLSSALLAAPTGPVRGSGGGPGGGTWTTLLQAFRHLPRAVPGTAAEGRAAGSGLLFSASLVVVPGLSQGRRQRAVLLAGDSASLFLSPPCLGGVASG